MSDGLISQYVEVHKQQSNWGKSSHKHRLAIQACIAELAPEVILEYGAGKSELWKELRLHGSQFFRFDPAIAGIDQLSVREADFVINTDVLEHIPKDVLPSVLEDIRGISANVYFYICTRPANLILPDGSNAHCTLMSPEEWLMLIRVYFEKAQLVHVDSKEGCVIITWQSMLNEVVEALEEFRMLQIKHNELARPFRKRLKKSVKKIRNRLLGRV